MTIASAGMAPRRGRPTAEDAKLKLAQVLAVAREQFCELGYRAVTMRDVAEKAEVSTRTLYNRYADKLSLFDACLDVGAEAFPKLPVGPQADQRGVLQAHAAAIVRALSQDSSLRLGMLVYREGGEFPELLRASEDNQARYLVQPLSAYLHGQGATAREAEELAKAFLALALSEWQRRITYRRPMPSPVEIDGHAAFATALFLNGLAGGRAELAQAAR